MYATGTAYGTCHKFPTNTPTHGYGNGHPTGMEWEYDRFKNASLTKMGTDCTTATHSS